jgi:phage tail sheath protein FI
MPPTFTFPGVYIEELSSGVHTITGVATSIAAFVGWAPKGPTDRATEVLSFSDYNSRFGGLDSRSLLGYSVNQFFGNGGQQAYIVRLVAGDAATATNTIGGTLILFATSPGGWANDLQVSVTRQVADPTRFMVQVLSQAGGQVLEAFPNLSATTSDPQFVVTVINNDSQLITFINPATGTSTNPAGTPTNSAPTNLAGGLDGTPLVPTDGNFETALVGNPNAGVFLLDRVDIFNLLCVPGETDGATIGALQKYCHDKRAFYIVDPPETATVANLNTNGPMGTGGGSLTGQFSINSAYYFPWVQAPDPLFGNRPTLFPPCGFVAGIYATTDSTRGVWKAPAGIDASLTGVSGLQLVLTDGENGLLNPQAINCLREFKVYGDVVWGARTLQGNDQAGSQWKYVPIRRLALFLESSLYDGTQWVVFEPNDETLWSQIRLNVGAFMQGLFLQGAFQGTTPQQAYFVKCDAENNPQSSIDLGIVNILVGFAPLFPAEFVVIQIQQMAGQI